MQQINKNKETLSSNFWFSTLKQKIWLQRVKLWTCAAGTLICLNEREKNDFLIKLKDIKFSGNIKI